MKVESWKIILNFLARAPNDFFFACLIAYEGTIHYLVASGS